MGNIATETTLKTRASEDTLKKLLEKIEEMIGGETADTGDIGSTPDGQEKIVDPAHGRSVKSLSDLADVIQTRTLENTRVSEGNAAAVAALNQDIETRTQDAAQQVAHTQAVRGNTVSAAANTIGRAEVACDQASLVQSAGAAQILAEQIREDLVSELITEHVGSEGTTSATGPVGHAVARRQARIAAGYQSCTSNNGGDSANCSANEELINADLNPESFLGGVLVLSDDPSKVNSVATAKSYIQNLLPEASTPLPKDRLENVSDPVIAEIKELQNKVVAGASMFKRQLGDYVAKRTSLEGLAAVNSLKQALTRAGVEGEAANRYLDGGNVSQDSMDYIRYRTFIEDPQTAITLAGASAANEGNTLIFTAQLQMSQIALLYDIREAIRQNTATLSAMGALMVQDGNRDIQNKINMVQSTPN